MLSLSPLTLPLFPVTLEAVPGTTLCAISKEVSYEKMALCSSCSASPVLPVRLTCDPSITSVADLAGRSICVGDVGSGTYFNTVDILAAYGLTLDDVNPVYQSFSDSTESLKDGKIDAAVITAGAPTTAVVDLATSNNVYLVSIDDEHMTKLLADCPWYASYTIPAGTYNGFDSDAVTVTVKATLVCRADLRPPR